MGLIRHLLKILSDEATDTTYENTSLSSLLLRGEIQEYRPGEVRLPDGGKWGSSRSRATLEQRLITKA